MNYLLAKRTLAEFKGGEPLPLMLAMSGTSDSLALYVRAAGAARGWDVQLRTLPFNTLAQALIQAPPPNCREIVLLLPWDLVPDADWRSGFPTRPTTTSELRAQAERSCAELARRSRSRLLYVPATLMPVLGDAAESEALGQWLTGQLASLGATILAPETFSLSSYLSVGCPLASSSLGAVGQAIVEAAVSSPRERCKVLVTDLDNVLWSGVVAEDGMDGISFRPEGRGYKHFIYQTLAKQLKDEGVLLAAVSRNDPTVALEPLRSGQMALCEADFVSIVASYEAKSSQIAMLAQQLNLGLDAFVFVDDNPIELAEVSERLPLVHSLAFPSRDDELPELVSRIRSYFPRTLITAEDRQRTELYRRRMAAMAPSHVKGADLTAYLHGLDMALTIHDRSRGDRTRAVELINKTNQFNLNGRRIADEQVAAILAAGGRLYTATLDDKHGTHGEILACLVTADGTIASLVMSCRVFQRRAEYAFLAWLGSREVAIQILDFEATARNQPIQDFLGDQAFTREPSGSFRFDRDRFMAEHSAALELITIRAGDERAYAIA